MKLFMKIAQGLPTLNAYHAVLRQQELFIGTNRLVLRSCPIGKWENHLAFDLLPQLRQYIFQFMTQFEGEILGQIELLNLKSLEEWIQASEVDFQQFGLVLSAVPGVSINDVEPLAGGDAFWALPQASFKIKNQSADEAMILLVQLRSNAPATYVEPQTDG